MKLPLTLSLYIGRQFVFTALLTLVVVLAIVGLIELLELVRRVSDLPKPTPFFMLLQMSMLKLPTSAEKVYPFVLMIGGMIALGRLARSSELVVARAAGISAWQFLMPCVLAALLMGIFFVTVMNPVAAATISRFDRLEAKYISNRASLLSISPSGLWLRQVGERGTQFRGVAVDEYILHAVRLDQSSFALEQAMLLLFDTNHRFLGRVDAPKAVLSPGFWTLDAATISTSDAVPETAPSFVMPTELTLAQIQDSFAAPETFSFWQLPGFIAVLDKAGFSAIHHRLHFHSLIAMPMLLAGMVMLSAVFTLQPPRRGRNSMLVVVGVTSGFLLYFLTNIIYVLGAAGDLPIVLAAWAPSLIVVMISGAALLHLEDG